MIVTIHYFLHRKLRINYHPVIIHLKPVCKSSYCNFNMGANLSQNLKKNCGIKEPKVIITRAWMMSLLCVTVVFFMACAGASKLDRSKADKTTAFLAMWTVLLLICISISGTVIMRKVINNITFQLMLFVFINN